MIRLLRQFAEWLDRRYPPKLYISVELFEELKAKEFSHAKALTSTRQELATIQAECASLQKSVAAIKDFIAKGGAVGPAAEKRRADFVATGRMAE